MNEENTTNQAENIQFISPELSKESILGTINTLEELYTNERNKAPNPESVYQSSAVIASAQYNTDSTIRKAELSAEISRYAGLMEDERDVLSLTGELHQSEPKFYPEDDLNNLTDTLKSQQIDSTLTKTAEGYQKLVIDQQDAEITFNFGFPDQQSANNSRAIEKGPTSEVKVNIRIGDQRKFFLDLDDSDTKDQVTNCVLPTLDLLTKVTNAINNNTHNVTNWENPAADMIVVNEGLLIGKDSRPIGYIQGDHYTPEKNLEGLE